MATRSKIPRVDVRYDNLRSALTFAALLAVIQSVIAAILFQGLRRKKADS